jgi:hypothetical protein
VRQSGFLYSGLVLLSLIGNDEFTAVIGSAGPLGAEQPEDQPAPASHFTTPAGTD